MLKKILIITILSLTGIAYSADQMSAEELKVQKKIDAANAAAQRNVEAAQAENAAFKTAISSWGSKLASNFNSGWTSTANGAADLLVKARASVTKTLNPGGADIDQAIDKSKVDLLSISAQEVNRARLKAEEARDRSASAYVEAVQASSAALTATNRALTTGASAAGSVAYQKSKEIAFDTWMATTGGLQSEMGSLNKKFSDLREANLLLERKLDNTVMASYMQKKMALLMGSDSLCKAASSCKSGKNTSKIEVKDLNSVFPKRTSENFSSEAAPAAATPASTNQ